MRQVTIRLDDDDFLAYEALLRKVNADRVRPIKLANLLRIMLNQHIDDSRTDYRYVREKLRKNAVRASSKPRERYETHIQSELIDAQKKALSIGELHREFDAYCSKHNLTPATFSEQFLVLAPEFNRKSAIDWYYHMAVPDTPETQQKFTEVIRTFLDT